MATAFKVERGVPLPEPKGGPGAPAKYPFGDMEVGDSFFVPAASYEGSKTGHMAVRRSASAQGKRNGGKYVSRAVEGGIRIWRTA